MATYKVNLNIGRTDICEGETITCEQLKCRCTESAESLCERGVLTKLDEPAPKVRGRRKGSVLTAEKPATEKPSKETNDG